jgi:hypothetical protein
MKTPARPYRQFLKSVVATRKFLIRTNRSMKKAQHMQSTIMLAEDLLNRMPSEKSVELFLKKYYVQVRDLIPATGSSDKRVQLLNELVNA